MESGRKKSDKSEQIDILFGEDEKPIQRQGQGIHNGVFYYASSHKGLPVIITSNREFYRKYFEEVKDERKKLISVCRDEIKDVFGLNSLTDFDAAAVDTCWENTDIRKFLNNENKEILLSELIDKVLQINKKHVYHFDERYHLLISYYILYTYAFTLFEFAPRINFHAMTSSGKSTQLKIIKNLKFNPLWISKASTSGIYRSVESTCGIPCIDNFDKINEDLKQDTFHFIEIAFDQEGMMRINESNGRGWKTKKYAAFCPLEITSTMPFTDDAVDNRCILIRMEKSNEKFSKLNTKTKELREIRNQARVFVLNNFLKIQQKALDVSGENRIEGRALDIWQGILTFAKLNSEEHYETLVNLACELTKESKDVNDSESLPRLVCLLLFEKLGKNNTCIVDISDFADEILMHELGVPAESPVISKKHRYYLKAVQNILQAFPSVWKSENISKPHNKLLLTVKKEQIENVMKMRGYKNENVEKKEILLTSNNPTNPTNQTNLCSPFVSDMVASESVRLTEVSSVNSVSGKNAGSICADCQSTENVELFIFADKSKEMLCFRHRQEAKEKGF